MGSFPPGELGTRHTSTYPLVYIGLGTEKDNYFLQLTSRLSGWFLPVGARSGTYIMYAPNKTHPESAWPQSRSRLHLSPSLLSSFYFSIFFSDLLPRARSHSHLTPKGEYIRYRYLLRDTSARNTCMYEKEWSIGGCLSTGCYRSSIRSGTL